MRFVQCKGRRLKNVGFTHVAILPTIRPAPVSFYYSDTHKRLLSVGELDDLRQLGFTGSVIFGAYPAKTFRAFKRFLRKHPWLKGRCMLVSRYRNCDIYG